MAICSDTSYGDLASRAKMQSMKIWIDKAEQTFSSFEAGKKYNCTAKSDRDALALLVTKVIQAKKPDCTLRAPVPPTSQPSQNRGPGSPPPR